MLHIILAGLLCGLATIGAMTILGAILWYFTVVKKDKISKKVDELERIYNNEEC